MARLTSKKSRYRRAAGWTVKQVRFIQWLALPESERVPKTQKELAGELNLRPATLSRWKRLPGFDLAVLKEAGRRLGQRMPEILAVIGQKAAAGDFRFVKLALELAGQDQNQQLAGQAPRPFSAEEYAAAAEAVKA